MESELSNQSGSHYRQSQECSVEESLIKFPQIKIKQSNNNQEELEQSLKINSQISSCSTNTTNQKIYTFYEILVREISNKQQLKNLKLIYQYEDLFEEILRNRNPPSQGNFNQQIQEEESQTKKDPIIQLMREKKLLQYVNKQNFQDNINIVFQKMDSLKVSHQKSQKRKRQLQQKNLGIKERLKQICERGRLNKQLTHSSLRNVSLQINNILEKYQSTLSDIQSLFYDFQSKIKLTQTIHNPIYSPQSERIIKKIKLDSQNIFKGLRYLNKKVKTKDQQVSFYMREIEQNIDFVKKTLNDNDSSIFGQNRNLALQGYDNSDFQ